MSFIDATGQSMTRITAMRLLSLKFKRNIPSLHLSSRPDADCLIATAADQGLPIWANGGS
jgi:hypothetical protein